MKHLSIFILFFLGLKANATNYYIAKNGSDNNAGTSINSPWQTLARLNSAFHVLSPGDSILFKRGDVFYGNINVTQSGSLDKPITISAYGKGLAPVITGFTQVTSWINKGGNIWESTDAVSRLSTCNMVVINGANTAMGRTPNYPNYYTWNSHTGNAFISTNLPGTISWIGAELAIFTTTYRNARHPITSQSGGTIGFASDGDLWQNSPGFFYQQFHIQNDIRTLDTLNEWYYNPSTKKLDIYNISSPKGVRLATVDTLIWISNKNNIIIRDIALTGANKDAIEMASGINIKIINCNISYIGGTAIYANTCCKTFTSGLRIDSNIINQVNNSGIDVKFRYSADTIRYNSLKNINMLIGMQNVQHTTSGGAVGILCQSDSGIVSYNKVDSTGIIGISYIGSNISIDHNLVTNTCMGNAVRDDGAIYTWNGSNRIITSPMRVFNNIILNTGLYSQGIYCDQNSNNIEIYNNTCYNTLRGIFLGDSHEINVHDNTTFNTGISNNAGGAGAGLMMNNNAGLPKLRNITLKNNKFIAKTTKDRALWVITTDSASMPKPFVSDGNYFAKPIGDNVNNIQTYVKGTHYVQRPLESWQALNGGDAHSRFSPKTITDTSDFNFQYNATNSPVTISLPYDYMDITGATYKGSVTLPPFSSWVGIKISNKKSN